MHCVIAVLVLAASGLHFTVSSEASGQEIVLTDNLASPLEHPWTPDRTRRVISCPFGWRRYGSSCYGIGDSPLSWPSALEVCRDYGATLAEVDSYSENEFLREIARSRGYFGLWLGGHDMFNEGHFEWAGSKRLIRTGFTDWGRRQPDNDENEDCLHIWRNNGYRWNDSKCRAEINFACELRL